MNILDLPPELITNCLLSVCGRDLSSVSRTCSLLREICSIDRLWQNRCSREFDFVSREGWSDSFREIYSKVLYRYGYCLGIWRETSSCYGGLIYIQYEPGCIAAREFYSLKDVRKPLKSRLLFKVTIKDDTGQVICHKGHGAEHPCTMLGGSTDESGVGQMFVHCSGGEIHRHPEGQEKEKTLFFEDTVTRGTHGDLVHFKWMSHRKLEPLLKLEQLHPAVLSDDTKVPIKPGFFKGMYGGHGTEIVLLSYDLEKNIAEARKITGYPIVPSVEIGISVDIWFFTVLPKYPLSFFGPLQADCLEEGLGNRKLTGDPNVPSGEISICADLSRPMVLTEVQQTTIPMLSDIDTFDLPPDTQTDEIKKQPFVVPFGVSVEDGFSLPKHCTIRYHSQGTVSPMGYIRPEKIVNHFIVFDEDTFGMLWLGLYSFGLFSRVHEEFDAR